MPARVVVIGANWVWAALLPLFAVLPWPLALGTVGGAIAFVGPAWNVVLGTYVLRLTPDRLLGRVRSVEMLVAWGVIPLGSLAAGYLLQWLGGAGAVAAMSGLMLAIAVAATASPAVRTRRRCRRPPYRRTPPRTEAASVTQPAAADVVPGRRQGPPRLNGARHDAPREDPLRVLHTDAWEGTPCLGPSPT